MIENDIWTHSYKTFQLSTLMHTFTFLLITFSLFFIFRIWLFEEIGKIPSMGGFTLAPQREYQKPYSSTFWTDAGVNQQWNIYHISYMQYIWNGDHVLIYPAWHKYWAIDKSKTCHWRMFWILSTVSICKAQRVLSYKHSRYFTNERIKKIYLTSEVFKTF